MQNKTPFSPNRSLLIVYRVLSLLLVLANARNQSKFTKRSGEFLGGEIRGIHVTSSGESWGVLPHITFAGTDGQQLHIDHTVYNQ